MTMRGRWFKNPKILRRSYNGSPPPPMKILPIPLLSGAFAVMGTHKKAKNCPMRPKSQQVSYPRGSRRGGRRFTVDQGPIV